MPYRYFGPDVYLEHKGVTVFYAYKAGTDEPCRYWFTTDEESADNEGSNRRFDARSLTGQWSGTPNVQQWNDWWKPRFRNEDEAVSALIRTAIDDGRML